MKFSFEKGMGSGFKKLEQEARGVFIEKAQEYLQDDDELRDAVVGFYSTTKEEAKNLDYFYKPDKHLSIDAVHLKDFLSKEPEIFRDYFSNKIEKLQQLTERVRVWGEKEKSESINQIATELEYKLGVYRDALESQVADAVFTLGAKGYLSFESGFYRQGGRERDQYMGFHNREIELPNQIVVDLGDRGFEIVLEEQEDRVLLIISPTQAEPVRLSAWKQIWDEVAEAMPENTENLEDIEEVNYNSRFRREQDELRPINEINPQGDE